MSELPELPDLTQLLDDARAHREHWRAKLSEAMSEVAKADTYIERLTGAKRVRQDKGASKEAFDAVLSKLGEHSYAGVNTLAGGTGLSRSTCGLVMREAVSKGFATHEKRGQRSRWEIMSAGQDYLTRPSTGGQ